MIREKTTREALRGEGGPSRGISEEILGGGINYGSGSHGAGLKKDPENLGGVKLRSGGREKNS